LRRERLLDLLESGSAPVTVLQAPSGFGKTTLVRQWLGTTGRAACWVPVSAGLRALPDEPVLVLDGYERLGAATPFVDALVLIRVATRPGTRVVITTRSATLLADPAREEVARVVGADVLAFTAEETERFLSQSTPDGRSAPAAAVHEATRGFPLAVRAASLEPGHGRTGDAAARWRTIVARDLSARLGGDATWRFVLDVCAAPVLDDELARALAGPDAPGRLAALARAGDGRWETDEAGRRVFRVVDSLREAARAELEATDADRHRWAAGVAATWLAARGEHLAALELAVSAGRHELAGRIVCGALACVPERELAERLDGHLSRIPRAAVVQHPRLALARALVLSGSPATRLAALELFARVVDATGADDHHPERLFHQTARSVALRHLGRYAEAAASARSALDADDHADDRAGAAWAPVTSPPTDTHQADVRAGALRHLALSLFQAGDLDRAHGLAARAAALAHRPAARADAAAYAAGLAAVDGRSRDAERLLPTALGTPGAHGLGAIGAALLRLDRFELADAIAEHDGASYDGVGELWPFVAWIRLQARFGLGDAGAELERVSAALRARPAPPGVGENLGTAALHGLVSVVLLTRGRGPQAAALLQAPTRWPGQLAPARLLGRLASNDAQGALELLARLRSQPGHTVRSRASLATLGAAAALRSGQAEAAGGLLDRAVALHTEHGVRAHLLHLPADDLGALRDLARRRENAAAAAYLDIAAAGGPAASRGGPAVAAGLGTAPLTNQEVAVLRASLDHPRRSQMAAALHLSPETVKSHMRSIYRKWGVNSREAAIERGIQLAVLGGRGSARAT